MTLVDELKKLLVYIYFESVSPCIMEMTINATDNSIFYFSSKKSGNRNF